MHLLICAGGTGGGVYPALAVLQQILKTENTLGDDAGQKSLEGTGQEVMIPKGSVLWIGGNGGMEADLVKRLGLAFEAIPAAGVHGVGFAALPGNLMQLAQGFRQARQIIQRFKPDVLFFTGGFIAVPVALAGWLPRRNSPRPRSLLYVPDIEPGLALKTLARLADRIAVTVEETRNYLPRRKQISVTGYPVRAELLAWDREEACRVLGVKSTLPTLLVLGGSKGARSINRALMPLLPNLLDRLQIIHICGQLDWPEVLEAHANLSRTVSTAAFERYRPYPYLHEEMGAALAVADLVVCRAGASVLGELPSFGLPAVLVPYPHAWRYQQVNAQYLADRGAAVVIPDAELPSRLLAAVEELLDEKSTLQRMSKAMSAAAKTDSAGLIASQLLALAKVGRR